MSEVETSGAYAWRLYLAILTETSKAMGIEEFLLDQAEKKGRHEGKQEGNHEKAIAIAFEMKADGTPIEQIVKFTKLSIKDIKKL